MLIHHENKIVPGLLCTAFCNQLKLSILMLLMFPQTGPERLKLEYDI